MNADQLDQLTHHVYRAALDRTAWDDAMSAVQRAFRSSAQSFYFLDLAPRRIRPMTLAGVDRRWMSSFDETYFAADNPWFRFTERLHRPGIVRTNEWLARFARDDRALYRSAYFNEWMRPQRLRYTMGSTLLAEHGVLANITLMRPPDVPTFDTHEVEAFARVSTHMSRALRMALRLEQAEALAGAPLDDHADHAAALLDADARLLQANRRMETILAGGHALARRDGRLVAKAPAVQQRLAALIAAAASDAPSAGTTLAIADRRGSGVRLALRARPAGARGHYLPGPTRILLTATEAGRRVAITPDTLQQLYALTPAEAGVAALVVEGRTLPDVARLRGIGYGTARGYLKIVFAKAGVHSQAALAARVLTDLRGVQ